MAHTKRPPDDLESLVIQAYPNARTTYEVAYQLGELLPIESHDDFVQRARLSVGGEELSLSTFGHYIPKDIFPISDHRDLVTKAAAVVRVASHVLYREAPSVSSKAHARLATELTAELAGASAPGGVRVFNGGPLSTRNSTERS